CESCHQLRHPPGPCCPNCRSFEWDTIEASGAATLYSYVVNHFPSDQGFETPYVAALVELEEGTRLVANLTDTDATDLEIGAPLTLTWLRTPKDLTLPAFRPRREGER